MKVVFFLKGASRIDWQVPPQIADQFNFPALMKSIRADGQFLSEGVYIQATELVAAMLDREIDRQDELDTGQPNVGVHHKNKVTRLMS